MDYSRAFLTVNGKHIPVLAVEPNCPTMMMDHSHQATTHIHVWRKCEARNVNQILVAKNRGTYRVALIYSTYPKLLIDFFMLEPYFFERLLETKTKNKSLSSKPNWCEEGF